ncbi:Uma2 family endonuclease [Thermus caldifontis]|uniref:Uma2 family endonuclease n=1 Tax=Thermus caldifontis TaxID=1930763 RepID=UPI000DF225C7|nr:Uma2 family endonuclease [Thermus caldifontis]
MTPVRKRFTVEEFHRMAQAGLLGEDDRVELLEGEVWEMSPIGSRHAAAVRRLRRLFTPLEMEGVCLIAVQDPVRLSPFSEPQPDLALLQPRPNLYQEAHPGSEDILLLVDVAEASLAYDLEVKAPLYARHGVLEFWVLDLEGKRLHVFRSPSPEGYQEVQVLVPGAHIAPLAFPSFLLRVAELPG